MKNEKEDIIKGLVDFDKINFDDIQEVEEIVTPGNGTIHCCC